MQLREISFWHVRSSKNLIGDDLKIQTHGAELVLGASLREHLLREPLLQLLRAKRVQLAAEAGVNVETQLHELVAGVLDRDVHDRRAGLVVAVDGVQELGAESAALERGQDEELGDPRPLLVRVGVVFVDGRVPDDGVARGSVVSLVFLVPVSEESDQH